MEINSIHSQFHKVLHGFILARVGNTDDAADILQEVFIKIAAKLGTLADSERLKSWIFSIARNAIIDYYRKNAGNKKTELTQHLLDEVPTEAYLDATKGLETCLGGFIQNLPEEYREIIIDSELKGISQKELSVKYHLPYPTMRSRVQRGRARLKEMLLDCCEIEVDSRGNVLAAKAKNSCGPCQ